jgi:hypothetical protein
MAQVPDLSGNFPPSLPSGIDARFSNDTDPALRGTAVTPSDSTLLNCRALYIGGTGSVIVQAPDSDATVTYTNVLAGTILPVNARRVMAATSATNIVALY